jgi:hypothetical protein
MEGGIPGDELAKCFVFGDELGGGGSIGMTSDGRYSKNETGLGLEL